jgi:vacuolar-type H+-ATPase subunit F/Vma7
MQNEPKYRAPMTKSLEKFLQSLEELKAITSNNDLTENDIIYVTDFLNENTKTTVRAVKTKRAKVTIAFPSPQKVSGHNEQSSSNIHSNL